MTPEKAAKRCLEWTNEYGKNLMTRGVYTQCNYLDKLGPSRHHVAEIIYAAGIENITREKVGLPPMTDAEIIARVEKDYGQHKQVRERIGYRRVYR